jgi:hypothetical protein
MAELLGVIASGIAVAQTADRIVSLLGPYIKQVKNAKEEIENLSAEVLALTKVLDTISKYAVGSSQELDDEIRQCKGLLNTIQTKLDRISTSETQKRFLKFYFRLAWPFKSGDVKDIIYQLERRKSNLSLYLDNDDR